jgi:hypothetical protein
MEKRGENRGWKGQRKGGREEGYRKYRKGKKCDRKGDWRDRGGY